MVGGQQLLYPTRMNLPDSEQVGMAGWHGIATALPERQNGCAKERVYREQKVIA